MIEISLGKLVLLALIALLVLGPEKLPGAARTAGALMRRMRNGWDSVRAEVERELEIEDIKRTAREAAARAEAAQADVKDAVNAVRDPFKQNVASAEAQMQAMKADVIHPDVDRAQTSSAEAMTSTTHDSAPKEPSHGSE
jgi:sec-independent protein translocase protein TatB